MNSRLFMSFVPTCFFLVVGSLTVSIGTILTALKIKQCLGTLPWVRCRMTIDALGNGDTIRTHLYANLCESIHFPSTYLHHIHPSTTFHGYLANIHNASYGQVRESGSEWRLATDHWLGAHAIHHRIIRGPQASLPVLSAMLSPSHAEGQSLMKTGVSTLFHPEDDPEAIASVFHSLHYNQGAASKVTNSSCSAT